MVQKFLQKVFNAFTAEPYRIILERKGSHFRLSAWRGKEPCPFSRLPQIDSLFSFLPSLLPEQKDIIISPEQILALRDALSHCSAVEVRIAADLALLKPSPVPSGFCLRLYWSGEECKLRFELPQGTLNLKKGWFLQAERLFQLEGLAPIDEAWLELEEIEAGPALLEFLQNIYPDWLRRGLPVISELQYSDEPAVLYLVDEVEAEKVILKVEEKVPRQEVKFLSSLPGYLVVRGFLRPGVWLSGDKKGIVVLQGEEIPQFLTDLFPRFQHLIRGKVEELFSQHHIFSEPGELILVLCRKEEAGIGRTYAMPLYSVQGRTFEAELLSLKMDQAKDYVHVEEGWIPLTNLKQAGIGSGGRASDLTPFRPLPLTPDELLRGGGARMEGPWAKRDFPVLNVPDADSEAETLRLHLDFLAFWGLPGGIVGGTKQITPALSSWIEEFAEKVPEPKILAVGTNRDLEILKSSLKQAHKGLVLATFKMLGDEPQLLREQWTILILLQADALVKSTTSRLYYYLLQTRKRLTIGTFTSFDFLRHHSSRQALARIFEVSYYSSIWQHTVRNPNFRPPPPPLRYGWGGKPVSISSRLAEYPIGIEQGKSIPIPPRPQAIPVKPVVGPEALYAPGTHSFFLDAEKLADYEEPQAEFVPFQRYYPTYYDMNSGQRKWYFFWRGQIRRGNYLDTDISYIFLHIYELINRVGVTDLMEGYEQICQIWRHYRGRFPRLDSYLVDWIADYALFYHAPIDPVDIYREALDLRYVPLPDLLLPDFLTGSCDRIPFILLEKFSAYDLRASSFYQKGGAELCEKVMPAAVELVNQYLLRERKQGLFQCFRPPHSILIRRRPFEGALFGEKRSEPITVATVLPYSQHTPLRDFLSAVFKHVENRLRETSNFRGRLSGYRLEPKIQALLDEKLFQKVTQVTLDEVKVKQLMKESDQVRDWLLAVEEESVSLPTPSPSPSSPPEEGDPWLQFFSHLTLPQRQALQAIAEGKDFSQISSIARENLLMPEVLIDSLNEWSLQTIGDFIIEPNSFPPSIEEEDKEIVKKWLDVLK